MSATTNRIPAALTGDPIDVTEALDVARALWDKGDHSDAIRWVRRAAEAAEEDGQTSRLMTLARAAAELEDASVTPPAVSQMQPAARPSPAAPLSTPASRPSVPASRPPVPASRPSVSPARSVAPPIASAPPSARSVPPPMPSSVPSAPSARSVPPPMPSSVPSAPSARSVTPPPLPSSRPSKPTTLAPVTRQPSSSVQPVRGAQQPDESRVRVSVRVSVRDTDLLVVRPLAEGQAPPPGTREAYLVMAEAAVDDVARAGGSVA